MGTSLCNGFSSIIRKCHFLIAPSPFWFLPMLLCCCTSTLLVPTFMLVLWYKRKKERRRKVGLNLENRIVVYRLNIQNIDLRNKVLESEHSSYSSFLSICWTFVQDNKGTKNICPFYLLFCTLKILLEESSPVSRTNCLQPTFPKTVSTKHQWTCRNMNLRL